jgi:hypothetical protein
LVSNGANAKSSAASLYLNFSLKHSRRYGPVFVVNPQRISHATGIFSFTPTEQLDGGSCAHSWELAAKAARVFDCFMFFNELKMLRLRLRVHSPVVDFFVIRWSLQLAAATTSHVAPTSCIAHAR